MKSDDADKFVDSVLNDPGMRQRLVTAVAGDLQRLERRSFWDRAQPFVAGASSALVVVLAFLIPSIVDIHDNYEIKSAVNQYAEIGKDLMARGEYASAESSFERALDLAGNQRVDLYNAQMKAKIMRVYEDSTWRGEIPNEVSESDFLYLLETESAARQPKQRAGTLAAYGVYLVGKKRIADAMRVLRQGVELDPTAPGPHIHLGNLYDDIGNVISAESEYRKAISMDARASGAHYNLGLLLAATQRPIPAEKEFRIYIKLAPFDAAGPLQLAYVLQAANDPKAALAQVEIALKLDPGNAEAQRLARTLRASEKAD